MLSQDLLKWPLQPFKANNLLFLIRSFAKSWIQSMHVNNVSKQTSSWPNSTNSCKVLVNGSFTGAFSGPFTCQLDIFVITFRLMQYTAPNSGNSSSNSHRNFISFGTSLKSSIVEDLKSRDVVKPNQHRFVYPRNNATVSKINKVRTCNWKSYPPCLLPLKDQCHFHPTLGLLQQDLLFQTEETLLAI